MPGTMEARSQREIPFNWTYRWLSCCVGAGNRTSSTGRAAPVSPAPTLGQSLAEPGAPSLSWNAWPARPKGAPGSVSPALGLHAQVTTVPPSVYSPVMPTKARGHRIPRRWSHSGYEPPSMALDTQFRSPVRVLRTQFIVMLAWHELAHWAPELCGLLQAGPGDAVGSPYSSYRRFWNHVFCSLHCIPSLQSEEVSLHSLG